jgi:hypothetical protein
MPQARSSKKQIRQSILEQLRKNDGSTASGISRGTGHARKVVSRALTAMEAQGIAIKVDGVWVATGVGPLLLADTEDGSALSRVCTVLRGWFDEVGCPGLVSREVAKQVSLDGFQCYKALCKLEEEGFLRSKRFLRERGATRVFYDRRTAVPEDIGDDVYTVPVKFHGFVSIAARDQVAAGVVVRRGMRATLDYSVSCARRETHGEPGTTVDGVWETLLPHITAPVVKVVAKEKKFFVVMVDACSILIEATPGDSVTLDVLGSVYRAFQGGLSAAIRADQLKEYLDFHAEAGVSFRVVPVVAWET